MRDGFGRHIHYLRISVTDRCDFRCSYCLPRAHRDFATPPDWMSPDEVARLVGVFARLGVSHVRLTGGEPLVRRELVDIVKATAAIDGIADLSLSTNASRLSGMAPALREAGVTRLNVSLDSLDPATFRRITGGDLARVLAGIDTARAAGFHPVKINTVAMRGVNDHEFDAIVDYCIEKDLTLRFIETMPMGTGGQQAQDHYLPLDEVEEGLRGRFTLLPAAMHGSGPARYLQVEGSALRIGFITPQSRHFCATCNRVRLSVTGELYLCLGQENKVALGRMLRDGADDADLEAAVLAGIANKPERHHFVSAPTAILRPMSALGG